MEVWANALAASQIATMPVRQVICTALFIVLVLLSSFETEGEFFDSSF